MIRWTVKNHDYDQTHMYFQRLRGCLAGGMYGAMLGKGKADEEEFWQQIVKLYKPEASAESSLRKLADAIRDAGEDILADCVASTIDEENEHAQRLAKVLDAHEIPYK